VAYSEEQVSDALAVLASNGGNVARTRRELHAQGESEGWTEVPSRSTLRRWQEAERAPQTTREEQVAESGHQKKEELAEVYERLTRQCLGAAVERMEEASFKDLMRAAGIATDKMNLLRGEATSIEEQRGVFQEINEALILEGPDGEKDARNQLS
jgi:hypothetical protein